MGQEAMEVSIDVKAIDRAVIEGAMDGISDRPGSNRRSDGWYKQSTGQ
jgi:hypothetical protein